MYDKGQMKQEVDVVIGSCIDLKWASAMPLMALIKKAKNVYCVDGGLSVLPDSGLSSCDKLHFLGDLDSLPRRLLKKIEQMPDKQKTIFSERKDFSDGSAALEMASKQKNRGRRLVVFGMSEGRQTHHFSNVMDCFRLLKKNDWDLIWLVGKIHQQFFIRDRFTCQLSKSTDCSVFSNPLCHQPACLTLSGFEYNLKKHILNGWSHGVSNQARAQTVQMQVFTKGGCCFLVETKAQKLSNLFWKQFLV